jgi:arginine decarboxylase
VEVIKHGTVHGGFLPKAFFMTKGKASSAISPLNAFDEALMDAGITQCNIVSVSSILPPDAKEIEPVSLTPGTITFAVLARMDGGSRETIGTGVAYAICSSQLGSGYGIVAEAHGYKDERALKAELKYKLDQMAKVRGLIVKQVKYTVESMEVPRGKDGCVVSALVYLPWDPNESLNRNYGTNNEGKQP